MASEFCQVEVWVVVDENGDYVVDTASDSAEEKYGDDIGRTGIATRMVKVTLKVPYPKPIEVTAELPEESSEVAVAVK